ncbi:transposase, partial [Thiolapillus sp.]|uniref:transposase n=1 Tax=Thiolapillus sp. TaxID=2017437 RepID=UPI003AF7D629
QALGHVPLIDENPRRKERKAELQAEHKSRRHANYQPAEMTSVSLPRDRFWDIQVSKIDSPTRQPLLPRPSCVRAASPHLRKLGAGYAALPQMTGRDFSYAYFVSPLRYRTPDKQCGPGRYRGLTAFASLSMAVSVRYNERSTVERVNGRLKDEFGARMVRVRGHAKVMSHLMFG